MNTCNTCIFWDKDFGSAPQNTKTVGAWGICDLTEGDEQVRVKNTETKAFAKPFDLFDDARLFTNESFGCNQWKSNNQ